MVSQLSNAGGRLIIASDGIWDTLSSDMAAKACRGVPAELAAKLVVKVMVISGNVAIFLRNESLVILSNVYSMLCLFF